MTKVNSDSDVGSATDVGSGTTQVGSLGSIPGAGPALTPAFVDPKDVSSSGYNGPDENGGGVPFQTA